MRILPTGVAGEIKKKYATEPIIFVGIEWQPGQEILYSSVALDGTIASLISLSSIDTSVEVDGAGVNQSVSVVLSDKAGDLKSILDTIDCHKVRAYIYLTYRGLPITERVTLIDGEINSPMVWGEGDRTFSFAILTRIESVEVGFSIEDGFFPSGDGRQRSAAWPIRFGRTCNYKTLQLTNSTSGTLVAGQGVVDPTLEARICQARRITCPKIKRLAIKPVVKEDPQLDLWGNPITTFPPKEAVKTNVFAEEPDKECEKRRFQTLCSLLRDRANQVIYTNPTLIVRGGNRFPQNINIQIKIKEVRYDGVMSGETFTITQTYHPGQVTNQVCVVVPKPSIGIRSSNILPSNLVDCATPAIVYEQKVVGGSGDSWRAFTNLKSSSFIWLPAGTEVFLEGVSEVVHIVSLLPGTVTSVSAYRTFGDLTLLTELPADYYEVITSDFGAYDVVELRLPGQLSELIGEGWSDEVYVSFVSSVGPNPTDIIKWILEKYTNLSVDAASFASVKTKLTKYPSNFVMDRKVDALILIKDIAYQARCGLQITDGVVKITYLSEEPSSLRTITAASIETNSFTFSHTTTEQLVTKHVITLRESGAPVIQGDPEDLEFSLKNNTTRYGLTETSWNYFSLNNEQQAIKTATFWLIRRSNTWRRINMVLGMEHLDLEVNDCVTISIPSFPQVKCIIESTEYSDNAISVTAWTPILSGTMVAYDWAWPAGEPAGISYPGPLADFVPDTPVVIPPEGHPLAGILGTPKDVASVGDRFPSDLGDILPVTVCRVSTGAEVVASIQPQFTALDFSGLNNALAHRLDDEEAKELDGVDYSFKEDDESPEDPEKAEEDNEDREEDNNPCSPNFKRLDTQPVCMFTVRISYVTSSLVAQGSADPKCLGKSGGPCSGDPGKSGNSCSGSFQTKCFGFGSKAAAEGYAINARAALKNLQDNCAYIVAATQIILVIGPTPIAGNFEQCGESANPAEAGPVLRNPLFSPVTT